METNELEIKIEPSTEPQVPRTANANSHYCKQVQQNLIDPELCHYSNRIKPLELKFEEICLSAKQGTCCTKKERLQILNNLSGTFGSQELIAIFGPSGSGKSSLMNVLAGYRERGITGTVYVNGTLRDSAQFRKLSCYIMQDDCLTPYLTVKEAMMVSANLKLENSVPKKLKHEIVEEILIMLGLDTLRAAMTRTLSGGQRKRLSVALELVNNPPVMFLDEPTSGLDSSTSYQVISLLKVLAHDGRMIICSIHQPSARLFEQFDHIYVLAKGECLYRGNVPAVVPFFQAHNLECPKYHNPADFVIEVASGDYGDVMQELIDGVKSGECEVLAKQYPSLTHMRFVTHVVIAVLLGLLYYGIGNESERVLNNTGFLFFCLLFIMFAALMPVLLSIHNEMPIFIREHLNFWYTIDSYFMARTASDVPFQLFYPTIYCTVAYLMSGQPSEFERFLSFVLVFIELSLVSQAFGLCVGAASPNAEFATFTGPVVMIPLTLFSGFFIRTKAIPWYMKWCSYISYQRYAFEAIIVSIYGNRPNLTCEDPTRTLCGFQNTTVILTELDVHPDSYWTNVSILAVFFVILRIICYLVFRLRIRLQH